MVDMKKVKKVILSLLSQNNILRNIIFEKDKTIEDLQYKIQQLESDLEYIKINGGIKRLVLMRD